jgi:DnaA regulatory inactivator Hda
MPSQQKRRPLLLRRRCNSVVNAPRQLPLDLGFRPALGRADFYVGASNADAVAWIDRWHEWPNHALALFGPPGCGKSHLVQVFAGRAGAQVTTAAALNDSLIDAKGALAIEDCDVLPDERALFHIFNAMREQKRSLLLTARRPPAQWSVKLPDLASRLKAITAVGIVPPDDEMFAAVLLKLFSDRQIQITSEVVSYVLRRIERSFEAARRIVADADAGSLAEGRAVTVPLLKKLLEPTAGPPAG